MKKNIILRQNKFFVCLWGFFHAVLFVGFLASVFFGKGLNVESNLFSMMPSSLSAKEIQAADSLLSERTGNNFFIFAGNAEFSKAKEAALEAFEKLSGHDEFSFLEVNASSFSSEEIASFVHSKRFNLLPKAIADEIKKRDDFIAQHNMVMDDLYARYDMVDAKLTAALREQEQKERKFNEPALYRQAEIKAEAEKLKKTEQPIDVNDKNIPAVIRQQVKKAGVDIVALKKELSR